MGQDHRLGICVYHWAHGSLQSPSTGKEDDADMEMWTCAHPRVMGALPDFVDRHPLELFVGKLSSACVNY